MTLSGAESGIKERYYEGRVKDLIKKSCVTHINFVSLTHKV